MCVSVCIHKYVYLYVHIYLYINVYVYIYVHTYIFIYIYIYIYTHICIYIHIYIYKFIYCLVASPRLCTKGTDLLEMSGTSFGCLVNRAVLVQISQNMLRVPGVD